MFILRLIEANRVLSFFSATQGYAYINLQTVNSYNQVLTYSLGLCATFASIKFLKMLRFSKSTSYFGLTLERCFGELVSYSILFFIMWFSFVQVMYLLYGNDLKGYSSLKKTMATAFQMMLGKFDASQINTIQSVLGPVVFSAYNVVTIFIALNIFITIIIDAFEQVKQEAEQSENFFSIFERMWFKVKSAFDTKTVAETRQATVEEYQSSLSRFPLLIDNLNDYIIRVIFSISGFLLTLLKFRQEFLIYF